MGLLDFTLPHDRNANPVEGNKHRELTTTGTFSLVATGTDVVIKKLFIYDDSDSDGGTVQVQDGAGNRIFQATSNHVGSFDVSISEKQASDLAVPAAISGLKVVVTGLTGTFSVGITWK